nr:MAG TPA: holin [Caudoviricetes sp.]
MQEYLAALEGWAIATGIRAIKTAGEALVVLIGSDMINVVDLNWSYILGATVTMMVLSVAMSLKGIPEVNDGSSVTSIVREVKK